MAIAGRGVPARRGRRLPHHVLGRAASRVREREPHRRARGVRRAHLTPESAVASGDAGDRGDGAGTAAGGARRDDHPADVGPGARGHVQRAGQPRRRRGRHRARPVRGSGALGIEALSRGAERVHLRRPDRAARAAVEANLAACGWPARPRVVAAPAERFLADAARAGDRFDLALLDPPYDFDGWAGAPRRAARPTWWWSSPGAEPPPVQGGRCSGRSATAARYVTILERTAP